MRLGISGFPLALAAACLAFAAAPASSHDRDESKFPVYIAPKAAPAAAQSQPSQQIAPRRVTPPARRCGVPGAPPCR